MYNRSKPFVVCLIICMFVVVLVPRPVTARFVLNPVNGFSPAAVSYTNTTFHFPTGADPYEGLPYWTYEVGSPTIGPDGSNRYAIGTDTDGQDGYFGWDNFADYGIVHSEAQFESSAINSPYNYVPLGWFYQKTNLESKTRWALAIEWSQTGIDLVYNTGNGDTPTSVDLVSDTLSLSVEYYLTLSNLGDQTYIKIQDISTYPTYPILYEGYKTTESYDATSLYAGFGQYSTASETNNGFWDDFRICDIQYTYSEDGTGFSRIDAYVDEEFTQTLYDMDEGPDTILDIDEAVTNITLVIDCWLNSTTYGVSTIAEGINIIRHNITVTSTNNTIVFSQSNLTYISGADYGDNVFLYQYSVELDFTITYPNIYTVVLTYEIYF